MQARPTSHLYLAAQDSKSTLVVKVVEECKVIRFGHVYAFVVGREVERQSGSILDQVREQNPSHDALIRL